VLGRVSPWLHSVAVGVAVGLGVVAAARLGMAALFADASAWLGAHVGPVWIPMAGVALRVAWLGGRAWITRSGRGALGEPVRPELAQLAPLFAALGLAGTVWGLSRAFDALGDGEFLERLPALLAGLGAAMTSTLAGLGLQIATLLVAAFNPTWSWLQVTGGATRPVELRLDGVPLGEGEDAIAALAESLAARQPEALALDLAPALPAADRDQIRAALWRSLDAAVPLRERAAGVFG
jgi:hypothetical protein